jgi:hypothetical protein
MKPNSSKPPLKNDSSPIPPNRLIGDRAYDSDRLDQRLMQHYGIEMIEVRGLGRTRRARSCQPGSR